MFAFFIFLLLSIELTAAKIEVALFLDKGAHARDNLQQALRNAPDIAMTVLDGEELRQGELERFDLLLVPGGSAKRESMSMKAEGREEVRRFVNRGGLYIGICAGCYLLTEARPSDIGLLPLRTHTHWQRGKGLVTVELTPLGQEVFGTNQKFFEILYHNGPVIDTSPLTPAAEFAPLGYYRTERVAKGGERGVMIGTPSMFFGRFGKGLVIGISPHPEANPNQVAMEINAVRWLYAHRTVQEPRHLVDVRELQEHVLPENNSYRHRDQIVEWGPRYVCHTDCSGLIDSLLEHAYHLRKEEIRRWLGKENAKARNYFRAISEQDQFERIHKVQDIQPGDLIAMKFLPGAGDKGHDTGHIMVVNKKPEKIEGEKWAVEVIDSSEKPHGSTDTRYPHKRGIGKGVAALYADAEGVVVGYSWTSGEHSRFYDKNERPVVIGRLN